MTNERYPVAIIGSGNIGTVAPLGCTMLSRT